MYHVLTVQISNSFQNLLEKQFCIFFVIEAIRLLSNHVKHLLAFMKFKYLVNFPFQLVVKEFDTLHNIFMTQVFCNVKFFYMSKFFFFVTLSADLDSKRMKVVFIFFSIAEKDLSVHALTKFNS